MSTIIKQWIVLESVKLLYVYFEPAKKLSKKIFKLKPEKKNFWQLLIFLFLLDNFLFFGSFNFFLFDNFYFFYFYLTTFNFFLFDNFYFFIFLTTFNFFIFIWNLKFFFDNF